MLKFSCMKLSTRGRYAVSAMFDLDLYGQDEPRTAQEISARQGIPLSYLEQLLRKLRKSKLIKAVKGPSGGYFLAKDPAQVRIGEIINAADGPVALADCLLDPSKCAKSSCCSTRPLWQKLSAKITEVFNTTTLKDLIRKRGKR